MKNEIYLKKFSCEVDFEYFFKLVSNKEIMVMNYGRVFTLEEAKKYYEKVLSSNGKHKDLGQFKVFEAITNNFIGLGAIVANEEVTEAEIEYLLLPDYWGKGYGSSIAETLISMAEGIKSIKKVTATADPNNVGSKKILLKNGFVSSKVYEIDDGSLAEMFNKTINDIN
ncbi:RimJ/RimL family protein N-acetyltransferase [Clostridium punense]|uniref:RimJ/RimL family protein N-acetyltransferase n=1 Tax=Clostridium punense TaxID=1054297 RepID=A0ABS4K7R2_9CLOT|nr:MULTISPECIES: GNAT family N-acetyltransferase [Clostridium]MBP2023340.1 RimJ/RimL family protein N-acetyltransferase [Clostridium punense]